jgi:Flp pilus assembly protein TadB
MLALQEAVDYDIEIVGNRVFLYGPLYDPAQQIPDMAAKLQKIKKELLDNILTYRDERLPFADGRQRVSIKGMSLKISRFWLVFGILANVAVVILWLLLEMWD